MSRIMRQNAFLKIINYNFAQCEICLKTLKTAKYLRLHMRFTSFKCDECNKDFRFKSNLTSPERFGMLCPIFIYTYS